MITHADYPAAVAEDIARLRRRMDQPADRAPVPGKLTDANLLIASWNIRRIGRLFPSFDENPGSPKRNLRALAYIAEIIRRFDVIAIQELGRETAAIRCLVEEFLGPDWDVILSDVTAGSAGNSERLAYIYDRRRVAPSGLAGEIVLPPTVMGDPVVQFARTPFICGFRAGSERFSLLTAHIKFGDNPDQRIPELKALADFTATEIRDRARSAGAEENNLIVLGDFNIDRRDDNPLFRAFLQTGLFVPRQLRGLKTTSGREDKFFDQIAWFMGDLELNFGNNAGVVDFAGAVYRDLTTTAMSHRVSDHFPLWAEFLTDRSTEQLAGALGLDPAMPNPLSTVPD